MADLDLNDIADKGVADLQVLIDQLSGTIVKPGADIAAITQKIEALEEKQADLRDTALGVIQESDANQKAVAAIKAASAALNAETKSIASLASTLAATEKAIGAAESLVTALASLV